jgi:hypothetical protein
VKTVSHHQKDKFKKSELLDEAYESTDFFQRSVKLVNGYISPLQLLKTPKEKL